MELTPEMQRVFNEVMKPISGGHMFVTGKAGSGKTTFLKYLLSSVSNVKNTMVVAPTGVAAINAGGQTIHSAFMMPFAPILPGSKLEPLTRPKYRALKDLSLLVIDEISMVRPDLLDGIDDRLRHVKNSDRPFGGIQVLMFGDPYQLPPVISDADWKFLKPHYTGKYFFDALVWRKVGFEAVEFTKVFRQTEQVFVDILNRLRRYTLTQQDLATLSGLCVTGGPGAKQIDQEYFDTCVNLCTHKNLAQSINEARMGKTGLVTFKAWSVGKFPVKSYPCPETLILRKGARVMSLVNNFAEGYYNGSLGTVLDIDGGKKLVTVLLDSGRTVTFEEHSWDNNEYHDQGGTVKAVSVGTVCQIPLIPAWAITIHKSQGLSFDKVFLHVSNVFSPGQLYVALSRCRSLTGLATTVPIVKEMVIPDTDLLAFTDYLEDHNNYWYRPDQEAAITDSVVSGDFGSFMKSLGL